MSKTSMMISAAMIALVAGTSAMATDTGKKGTLIPIVPVPNSTSTNVFGISDSVVITGSWLDASGVEHGYVGPLSGTKYKTFDDPNSPGPGTEPRAINNNGYITGFSNSQNGATNAFVPFERDPKGNITEITKKGALLNYIAQGLNTSNEFAGSYVNNSLTVVGYLGENGQFKKGVKLPGITNTGVGPRAVNTAGDVVGWYYDSNTVQHGFLLSGGKATTIDYPANNAASTLLEGINDNGWITGYWTDTSGILHGFFYQTKSKKFRNINVPGSTTFVQVWGVSNSGLIAVGSDAGNFIYCPAGVTCPSGAHATIKPPAVKPKPQLP